MPQRLYKVAGTSGSSGINSCPTVIGEAGDDVDVIVWGAELDSETSAALSGPPGETGVRIPRALLIEAAAALAGNE